MAVRPRCRARSVVPTTSYCAPRLARRRPWQTVTWLPSSSRPCPSRTRRRRSGAPLMRTWLHSSARTCPLRSGDGRGESAATPTSPSPPARAPVCRTPSCLNGSARRPEAATPSCPRPRLTGCPRRSRWAPRPGRSRRWTMTRLRQCRRRAPSRRLAPPPPRPRRRRRRPQLRMSTAPRRGPCRCHRRKRCLRSRRRRPSLRILRPPRPEPRRRPTLTWRTFRPRRRPRAIGLRAPPILRCLTRTLPAAALLPQAMPTARPPSPQVVAMWSARPSLRPRPAERSPTAASPRAPMAPTSRRPPGMGRRQRRNARWLRAPPRRSSRTSTSPWRLRGCAGARCCLAGRRVVTSTAAFPRTLTTRMVCSW
mmetsp:Transcript_59830/g.172663  ORF Transcript_59830/g.172663 Transcript_59830/m.172663 type:complete len:366 (-) Transcript_59830:53-1150(-)